MKQSGSLALDAIIAILMGDDVFNAGRRRTLPPLSDEELGVV